MHACRKASSSFRWFVCGSLAFTFQPGSADPLHRFFSSCLQPGAFEPQPHCLLWSLPLRAASDGSPFIFSHTYRFNHTYRRTGPLALQFALHDQNAPLCLKLVARALCVRCEVSSARQIHLYAIPRERRVRHVTAMAHIGPIAIMHPSALSAFATGGIRTRSGAN